MKKLLFIPILFSFLVIGCGQSEEAKKAEQEQIEQEVDKRINDIMKDLEQSSTESASDTASGAAGKQDTAKAGN
ncbi:MAG: hypothetical protein Kow0075_15120 [Salibacteraceae bacterium]